MKPPRPTWLEPSEYPPPRGTKLLVLTAGGIATVGHWASDCIGWLPLPDSTPALKRARSTSAMTSAS